MTTTLGRGGSDYSAAILAEGVGADELEIWTDVAGIATTDPRLCPAAKPIHEISFKEASELATFGAKVLHPATLLPAIRKNIPVFVGSSFDAEARGTWVKKEVTEHPLIRAMALRKKQVLVTISTPEMLHTHGFLFQVFRIFNEHKVSIDAITTSEISVSVTLDDSTLLNKKLIADLSQIADVQVEDNLCLISLIGNNINHTSGLAKKIFETIPEINVRMICLGASKHNFCFLVKEDQGAEAVQKLHAKFIEV
jgi:aspartate kinase